MRDRLIELLNKKYDHFCDQCGVNKDSHYTENLADYLLANGVIVPPCKAGDTLYLVRQDVKKIIEVIVTAIIQRHTFQYAEVDIVEDNRKSLICLSYWGNRLFPTKEEAKQALKGGVEE